MTLGFSQDADAAKWRSVLLWAANSDTVKDTGEPDKRKALVLLNPFGGAGTAERNWEEKAKPLLQYAHMDISIRYTERAKHA